MWQKNFYFKNIAYYFLAILFLLNGPHALGLTFFDREVKNLLESEKNTIQVYQNNVKSIVHVANLRRSRGNWFERTSSEVPTGTGSGFVWDKKGHIVTNFHVIAGGDSFLITFKDDKKQYRAKLVGSDPKKDMAVLKLTENPRLLYPVSLGDSSKLIVGQKAMAIGNPFGLDHSITSGVISALERKIEGVGGVSIHKMIQTDCSINPGNSGGPLLSSSGQLIGMNTVIYSKSGQSSGIGFAVPSNTIARIAPQLIKDGKVSRAGLGITLASNHIRPRFGIKQGIVIESVMPSGPANIVGLEGISQDRYGRWYIGDVIVKIAGEKVNSYDEIYHVLDKYKAGDKIEVAFRRKNKLKKVSIKLIQL